MARWDRLYLQKVKKASLKRLVYDRYVDDSNQIGEEVPPGKEYNVETGKMTNCENNPNETDEERTVRIFIDVANSVLGKLMTRNCQL